MIFRLILATLLWIAVAEASMLSTGQDAHDFINKRNIENDVTIFSKSYCPYCKATKATFQGLAETFEIKIEAIELDTQESNDGQLIQDELYEITGQRTVPNVFVAGMPIGGNSDVQRMLEEGNLEEMLSRIKSALAEDL